MNQDNNDPYRPRYHFTPPQNWMNDPNGLVYYDGEYHLFYQHHPESTVWGPMHWGHAVSRDLLHWEHLPIALYPDEHGTIFSGSAVIDWHNTAGFGAEAMVAIFTHNFDDGTFRAQSQSLAYSLDRGRSWTKHDGNPVIPGPEGQPDFRDPKVFWYSDPALENEGHWVMVLAVDRGIWFYISPNLKVWTKTYEFQVSTLVAETGDWVWEVPDLFPLQIEGSPITKWVLILSTQIESRDAGMGVQYILGDFDGQTFSPDSAPLRWADFGADFYAAISWSNVPNDRRLWLGWMSNWAYARETPPTTWRGMMSLPRELALVRNEDRPDLIQRPITETQTLRNEHWHWSDTTIATCNQELTDLSGDLLEIMVQFQVNNSVVDHFGLKIYTAEDQGLIIGYDPKRQVVYIDRSQSGLVDFYPDFAARHHAIMAPQANLIKLHLFLDRSSMELFANDGRVVFSERIFPTAASFGLSLIGADEQVVSLDVYRL